MLTSCLLLLIGIVMVFSPGGVGHLYLSSLQAASSFERMVDLTEKRDEEKSNHVYREEDLTDADGDTIGVATEVIGKGEGRDSSSNDALHEDKPLPLRPVPEPREDLALFVGVTSGYKNHALRFAARQTWLANCTSFPSSSSNNTSNTRGAPSTTCLYKFFIDKSVNDANPYERDSLLQEQQKFDDIVFKDDCSLMTTRHPYADVHYGNTAHYNESSTTNPDYQLRRMYKIDWKVCIFRWALKSKNLAEYFLLVEDDSYSCLGNIEYQISRIKNSINPAPLVRAGTPMFDGFDDSSTLMSGKIAAVFALYYPSPRFDCSQIWAQSLQNQRQKFDWLSWGNSWIYSRCGWRQALEFEFNLTLVQPAIDCFTAKFIYDGDPSGNHPIYAYNYTQVSQIASTKLDFPCAFHPIIVHGARAAEMYLREVNYLRAGNLTEEVRNNPVKQYKTNHICEYVLTIDKIKDPRQLYDLHEITYNTDKVNDSTFHDLSHALTNDDHIGWLDMLRNYERDHNVSLSSVSADLIKDATERNKIAYMKNGQIQFLSNGANINMRNGTVKDNRSITSAEGSRKSLQNHEKNNAFPRDDVEKERLRSKMSRRSLLDQHKSASMSHRSGGQDALGARQENITIVEEPFGFAFFYYRMVEKKY